MNEIRRVTTLFYLFLAEKTSVGRQKSVLRYDGRPRCLFGGIPPRSKHSSRNEFTPPLRFALHRPATLCTALRTYLFSIFAFEKIVDIIAHLPTIVKGFYQKRFKKVKFRMSILKRHSIKNTGDV